LDSKSVKSLSRKLIGGTTAAIFGVSWFGDNGNKDREKRIEDAEVTPEQKDRLNNLFVQHNPTGKQVEKLEFIAMYQKMVPNANIETAESLFELLDGDHDGKISQVDFVTGIFVLEFGKPIKRLELFFKSWDKNNDGSLSHKELEDALQLYIDHKITRILLENVPSAKDLEHEKIHEIVHNINSELHFSASRELSHFYSRIDSHGHRTINLQQLKHHVKDLPPQLKKLIDPEDLISQQIFEEQRKREMHAEYKEVHPRIVITKAENQHHEQDQQHHLNRFPEKHETKQNWFPDPFHEPFQKKGEVFKLKKTKYD